MLKRRDTGEPINVRTCTYLLLFSAAIIRERRLFRSTLTQVRLQFESGVYSRAAFIRERHLFGHIRYVCMRVRKHACACVCAWACMHACVHVYVHAYVCVCLCMCMHACVFRICMHIMIYAQMYCIHMCTCMRVCMRVLLHMYNNILCHALHVVHVSTPLSRMMMLMAFITW